MTRIRLYNANLNIVERQLTEPTGTEGSSDIRKFGYMNTF